MNVRNEIDKYASKENKPALLYLFSRYHWQSQWNFVAKCTFEGRSPGARRVWSPTAEGTILYEHALSTKEPATCNWCRMAADPNNASVTACPFHIVSLASEKK